MLKESCVDVYDQMGCETAANFCATEFDIPFEATGVSPNIEGLKFLWKTDMRISGRNVYDVSKPCEGPPDALCYPITKCVLRVHLLQ